MFVDAVCEVYIHYLRDFCLCMSQHTQTEISMLTKLYLAHMTDVHTVHSALIVDREGPNSASYVRAYVLLWVGRFALALGTTLVPRNPVGYKEFRLQLLASVRVYFIVFVSNTEINVKYGKTACNRETNFYHISHSFASSQFRSLRPQIKSHFKRKYHLR